MTGQRAHAPGPTSPACDPRSCRSLLDDSLGWDVTTWARALPVWLAASSLRPGARALEVGVGGSNAGLSLWLAAQGHSVVCSGLEEPSEAVRALHRRHGVADRISYARHDVLELPYDEAFDLVVFKSVLGRVGARDRFDRQQLAVERLHRALRPGGELWFAENAAGTPAHRWGRARLGAARWEWRYVDERELPVLLAPFARATWVSFGVTAALGRTERQRRLLGLLDGAVLDRTVPSRWHYVTAGVAVRAT